jgi:hypothetical protein
MMVPHELALHFDQLHLEVIQLTHDLGAEMVLKSGKLLRQIDYLHVPPPPMKGDAGRSLYYSILDWSGRLMDSPRAA